MRSSLGLATRMESASMANVMYFVQHQAVAALFQLLFQHVGVFLPQIVKLIVLRLDLDQNGQTPASQNGG